MTDTFATLDLSLPTPPGRGRVSPERRAQYEAAVAEWCRRLLEIKPRVGFDPGPRGWCYIMEEHGLSKGDFQAAQKLITKCRKDGLLPLDFCGDDDDARDFIGIESLDDPDPMEDARTVMDYVDSADQKYSPLSFWTYQDYYVQMLVEKVGLRNLFEPVCRKYHVPLGNGRGSSSIWQRIKILKRFAEWGAEGKYCVLLYCGDHDPHGVRISRSLRTNLEELLPAFRREYPEHDDFDLRDVEVERFGLNADFIKEHNLSWTEGLITGSGLDLGDPSHRKNGDHDVQSYIAKFGPRKVEADALVTRPAAGRNLCEATILKYVHQDGIRQFEEDLRQKRQEMRQALDQLLRSS
jgi:hypothetical protein